MSNHNSIIPAMMDMVPIFFFAFKILVFGVGMFFAIKWHYDKAKKQKEKQENEMKKQNQAAQDGRLRPPPPAAENRNSSDHPG